MGRTDRVLWEDFLAGHSPPQSLDELLALKREKVLKIIRSEQPLFEGMAALVRDLSGTVPLALASGSERPIVEAVLSMGGLEDVFRVTVSGSEIVNGKPEPDIFLETARLLGQSPSACVVVEDSLPGIAAARAAGMRVIAVTNTHPAQDLDGATLVAAGAGELRRALMGP